MHVRVEFLSPCSAGGARSVNSGAFAFDASRSKASQRMLAMCCPGNPRELPTIQYSRNAFRTVVDGSFRPPDGQGRWDGHARPGAVWRCCGCGWTRHIVTAVIQRLLYGRSCCCCCCCCWRWRGWWYWWWCCGPCRVVLVCRSAVDVATLSCSATRNRIGLSFLPAPPPDDVKASQALLGCRPLQSSTPTNLTKTP